MVEKAIELNPKIADFYDSRGGIYLKMERYTDAIADLDREVALLGRVVRNPGFVGSSVMKAIRIGERGSVERKIEILS